MVSKELLEKFKKLYQEKYNVTLNDEEATQMATDLVNLMQILLKPLPPQVTDKSKQIERRENETFSTYSS
jgi:hypothetical protein